MTRRALALGIFLVSCRPGGDARAGDRAYVSGQWAKAAGIYAGSLERSDAATAAKALESAVRIGDAGLAVRAAERLVLVAPARREEAVAWLLAASRSEADSVQVLRSLVRGVVHLQPRLPAAAIGRTAGRVLLESVGDDPELDVLLPSALAAASDPDATVRLLLRTARGAEQRGDFVQAAYAYRAAQRRSREPAAAVEAGDGVIRCALRNGEAALSAGGVVMAERWFEAAISGDSSSLESRAALTGLGRTRALLGDEVGARAAFAAAASKGPADSVRSAVPATRDSAVSADTT